MSHRLGENISKTFPNLIKDSCLRYTKNFKIQGFTGGSVGKESTCNVGDLVSIPGLGSSPGEGDSFLHVLYVTGCINIFCCLVLNWMNIA